MSVLCAVGVMLVIGPLTVVLLLSFTGGETLRFPPEAISLRWYAALLDTPEILRALATSLEIAAYTTLIAILFAVPAALAIVLGHGRSARIADSLFMAPMLLPAIALGLAMLMMFSNLAIGLSKWTLVAGHVLICVPYILRTTMASASALDPALIEASRALGASFPYTLRRIVLPLVRGGVMAGAFIAFMMSFDHVPVSLFLADARTEVLPIRLWYMIFHTLDVRTAAVSGVMIVATFTLMAVMERVTGLSRHLR
jgi:putative spermidine/putrescine transport system permease protein